MININYKFMLRKKNIGHKINYKGYFMEPISPKS